MENTIKLNKHKLPIGKIIVYILLSLWALTTIYPFVWVLINSFKEKDAILVDSFSLPFKTFTLANYDAAIFGRYNIFRAYLNSFIISFSVVIIVIIISTLAGYVMARYNFPGKKIVRAALVACMMFPIFSIIFPLYSIIINLGLMDQYLGVILPQVAGNLAFTTILLSGFFKEIPKEVEESAYMDGAGIGTILFRIVLPMSKSSISTASIFVFLWSYNDLFLQMLILKDRDMMPISALLREISSKEGGTNQGLMVAAVALIAIPILIIYFFLQKNIIKGLTAGAVKG